MVVVLLLLFVGGIGLSMFVCDPKAVTLRWLRLGGLNAIGLFAVGVVVLFLTDQPAGSKSYALLGVLTALLVLQLLFVQTAKRLPQRICCALIFLVASAAAADLLGETLLDASRNVEGFDQSMVLDTAMEWSAVTLTMLLSAGMLGGYLMTMLLGHAYLTAGNEMTQAPFIRLVGLLAVVLIGRLIVGLVFGLKPYMTEPSLGGLSQMWDVMMVWARFLVGIAMPALFTYMVFDCVKRRSNQSATGILYVAGILVILGEGIALALIRATGEFF